VTLSAFDHALGGNPALLLRSDGGAVRLDVARWNDSASPEDAWLLDRCSGAVVDLGCGPGRLLSALADRGVPALGIDVSPEAETRCRRRGVPMLRADLFAPLPGEGRWDHVLLADGNIGIGGDPVRLLNRVHALLRSGGTAFVEVEPADVGVVLYRLRLRMGAHTSAPFRWASVGADAVRSLATEAGLDVTAWRRAAGRCVAVVTCGCPDGRCRPPRGAST
jgi:SAM-dependent methyltransferase